MGINDIEAVERFNYGWDRYKLIEENEKEMVEYIGKLERTILGMIDAEWGKSYLLQDKKNSEKYRKMDSNKDRKDFIIELAIKNWENHQ